MALVCPRELRQPARTGLIVQVKVPVGFHDTMNTKDLDLTFACLLIVHQKLNAIALRMTCRMYLDHKTK
jgi:hypothetical protein